MKIYQDLNGLDLHAPTSTAVASFDKAIDRLIHYQPGIVATMDSGASSAGLMPMSVVLEVYLAVFANRGPRLEEASKRLAVLLRGPIGRMTARERWHLDAACCMMDGNVVGASRRLRRLTRAHPHDILALAIGQQVDLQIGDTWSLRARVGEAIPNWRLHDARYASVLGMYAFALSETGALSMAQEFGLAAAELDQFNVWAVHAVSHTYERARRFDDGVRWLEKNEDLWQNVGAMRVHLCWHYCLAQLRRGHVDRLLKVYDEMMAPSKEGHGSLSRLVDCSSLLWRLHLEGVDVRGRAGVLSTVWKSRLTGVLSPFNDLHACMGFLMAADFRAADDLIGRRAKGLRSDICSKRCRRLYLEVGLPVLSGLVAFERGEYSEAARLLSSSMSRLHLCGGSSPQREVFRDVLRRAVVLSRSA